jgi:flagellin-like hook-associated protein FlgL
MSRLSITTNIASLSAQRNLAQTSRALESSFTRLSSGMRINRASDDAAGLSVSSFLDADRRVLTQGIRNLNDGMSYLDIAESAISELTNIVFRVQELAEQSANGTLSSIQRGPLQDEVTALQSEYNRIINSTKFNNTHLLTGANTLVNLQAGYGTAGGLAIQVGNALVSDALGTQSAGHTIRISTSSNGEEANGLSEVSDVSSDGRFVVFSSSATNLLPGVSGSQVYLKDLELSTLTLISSTEDEVHGNGSVRLGNKGSVSFDGRFVAFQSDSTNLIPVLAVVRYMLKIQKQES